ncbi:hypothetical protein O181_049977 [Austropuccinia psidii MF-1]|uniref:Uncharacterized protein n=1 Tax=Austropuccinia psidii MF-1 TaxID=1389203 RepID=A0A9Q3DY28_9BASI|nr:hypothetical protein [Austropuccinia psidii MF-1]
MFRTCPLVYCLKINRVTVSILFYNKGQEKLYSHCIDETLPSLSPNTQPSVADNKIIDANIETCNIITNRLDSSTFAEIVVARIWSRSSKITYNGDLQSFITKLRRSLNEAKTIGIKVRSKTLAFSILSKLPKDLKSLSEKVTLNTETQGNPGAILNLLHDATLKQEALNQLKNTNNNIALNREVFKSKKITIAVMEDTIHYQIILLTNVGNCTLNLDQINIEEKPNLIIPFLELYYSTISTGCDSSSLEAIGKGTSKLMDRKEIQSTRKKSNSTLDAFLPYQTTYGTEDWGTQTKKQLRNSFQHTPRLKESATSVQRPHSVSIFIRC